MSHAPVTEEHRKLAKEIIHGPLMGKKWPERIAQLLADALAAEAERVRRETLEVMVEHYPIQKANRGERDKSIEGWTECACGAAKADGVTPYKEIWQAHIRTLAARDSTGKQVKHG